MCQLDYSLGDLPSWSAIAGCGISNWNQLVEQREYLNTLIQIGERSLTSTLQFIVALIIPRMLKNIEYGTFYFFLGENVRWYMSEGQC